jgi:hypothetical protein
MKQPVNSNNNRTNKLSIKGEYNLLEPLLQAIYLEMKVLSSKKQDGALNGSKVTVINYIIRSISTHFRAEA